MKSLSRSSKVGEGGGDGEGGVGSRGGRMPCFRRASLLRMIEHIFFKKREKLTIRYLHWDLQT